MTDPTLQETFVKCEDAAGKILSARKAVAIRKSVGGRCECCGTEFPPVYLEIHFLNGGEAGSGDDLVDLLLVLCRGCHRSIHTTGISNQSQELLVSARPGSTRQKIKKILSRDRTYTPPESGDPAELYSLAVDSLGIDLFLNGA
jgi:hypothetical protein